MALTDNELRNLIAFNIPDNVQQLVTPRKVRDVLNELVDRISDDDPAALVFQSPLSYNIAGKLITIQQVTSTQSGYLNKDDFNAMVRNDQAYTNPSWLVSIPISKVTNLQNALDGKAPVSHTHGIGDITNLQTTLDAKADLVAGKVPQSQLPAISIGETFTVGSQAAMLALDAQNGDVAIRTDLSNRRFLLSGGDPTVLGNWLELGAAGAVTSVNGYTGVVVLAKGDVGLGNVPNIDATNANNITAGTLADARLSANVVLTTGSYSNPAWVTALAWSKITGTPTTLAGYGITDSVVLTTGSYANPSWITSLAWSKITGAPAFLTSETDPVFSASAAAGITSTNISNWNTAFGWGNHASAGYVLTSGSYANPAWITSLAWSKISSTPTTRAGYGITDVPLTDGTGASGTWGISISGNAATVTNGVVTTGSYANPSWITSLAWSKLTGVPSSFTPSAHSHTISDVTGLQMALDGKLSLTGGTLTGALSGTSATFTGNIFVGGSNTTSQPSLNKAVYVQSATNNEVVGYSLLVSDGTNNPRASFFLDEANLKYGHDYSFSTGGLDYVIRRAGVTRFTILDNGNTGVGFSAPETQFQVKGTSGITSFTGTSRLGISAAGATSVNDYSGIDFDVISAIAPRARIAAKFTGSGSVLEFGTSNSYAAGITNTALSIDWNGVSTFSNDIVGLSNLKLSYGSVLYWNSSANQYLQADSSGISIGAGGASRIYASTGGNVGIGTTSPSFKTVVAPSIAYTGINTGDGLQVNGAPIIGTGTNLILAVNSSASVIQSRDGITTNNLWINPFGNRVLVGTSTDDGTSRLLVGGTVKSTADQIPYIFVGTSATTMFTQYMTNTSTTVGYIGNGTGVVSGGGNSNFGVRAENDLVFAAGGNNERFRIAGSTGAAAFSSNLTVSGHLSVSATFVSWPASYRAVQVGTTTVLHNAGTGGNETRLSNNLYYDGELWRYQVSSVPALLVNLANDGSLRIFTAPSGTAGNTATITERFDLNASGIKQESGSRWRFGARQDTTPNFTLNVWPVVIDGTTWYIPIYSGVN